MPRADLQKATDLDMKWLSYGRTKERSLSIHINPHGSSVIWICHRATCGWSGSTKRRPMSVGSSTPELETLASENATSDFEVAYAISDGEVAYAT